VRRDPGGGGINVARAMTRLGVDVTALWSCGGRPGRELGERLDAERVVHETIAIEGETRVNFTASEARSGQQYRFDMPGPDLTQAEYQRWLHRVATLTQDASYLVLSGSLPPNAPLDFYAQLIAAAPRRVRIVLDACEEALVYALRKGVFLLKPNLRELSRLVGTEELTGDREVEAAASQLIDTGRAQLVAVSLGRAGAMLVSAGVSLRVHAPTVRARSTIGAGDSMLAGLLTGLLRELPLHDALRLGVAAGSAATMAVGTQLFERENVTRLYDQLRAGLAV